MLTPLGRNADVGRRKLFLITEKPDSQFAATCYLSIRAIKKKTKLHPAPRPKGKASLTPTLTYDDKQRVT